MNFQHESDFSIHYKTRPQGPSRAGGAGAEGAGGHCRRYGNLVSHPVSGPRTGDPKGPGALGRGDEGPLREAPAGSTGFINRTRPLGGPASHSPRSRCPRPRRGDGVGGSQAEARALPPRSQEMSGQDEPPRRMRRAPRPPLPAPQQGPRAPQPGAGPPQGRPRAAGAPLPRPWAAAGCRPQAPSPDHSPPQGPAGEGAGSERPPPPGRPGPSPPRRSSWGAPGTRDGAVRTQVGLGARPPAAGKCGP